MEFDEDLMIDFNGVIVLKYNNTSKFSTIFDSGISVTTEKVEDILQMMLLVPPMFKGGYTPGNNVLLICPCLFRLISRDIRDIKISKFIYSSRSKFDVLMNSWLSKKENYVWVCNMVLKGILPRNENLTVHDLTPASPIKHPRCTLLRP